MRQLRYGDEGYEVLLLQYALMRAGEDIGNLDGLFGRRTLRALQVFQRKEGLAADGIAGKLTWSALFPFISGYTLHKLTAGDTFYNLSNRFGTSVSAIQTANPDMTPENLPVGETLVVPLAMPVVTADIPVSHLLTGLMQRGLSMRYPFLRTYEIGRSVMGRPITALSIGNGSKQVGYNASHHANESITTLILLRFLEDYAKAYASDEMIGDILAGKLYEETTLHMVPLVNPDGADLVGGALSPDDSFYAQAKALSSYYPSIPFPSGWKANIFGIDLNLQYPAGWEIAREIKFSQGFIRPGPRDYVGEAPLSAPESRAMARWTEEKDFSLTLAYHTQGKTIYWRYEDIFVPGAQSIGEAFSQSSGYLLEDTPYASGHAGYKDWFIESWVRPGYTIEAGTGQNPLPLSAFPSMYRENLPILVLGLTLSP